uniref:Sphingomyelin synthetase, putative n=1 Tax=Entamoeba invadens TaxID=33085 RepID=S0B2R6_ENTIV|nr:sphingomyelin synthetase, putative [Entamoeba invadens]
MNCITGTLLLMPIREYPKGLYANVSGTLSTLKAFIWSTYEYPRRTLHDFLHSQLMWAVTVMIICGYWNSVFQIYADSIAGFWKYKHQPFVLMDIAFDVLPHIESEHISDYYLKWCIYATAIRFMFTPLRLVILRRYCFMQAVIFLLRGFSVFATLLPCPMTGCVSTAVGNPFVEALYIMLGYHRTCADLLFSGHTANLTMCAFIWEYYCEKVPFFNPVYERVASWIAAMVGFVVFLSNHFRYSCDVFVGFVMAALVFNMYHSYVLTISTRNNFFNSFLRWFEEDADEIPKLVRLASRKTLTH